MSLISSYLLLYYGQQGDYAYPYSPDFVLTLRGRTAR